MGSFMTIAALAVFRGPSQFFSSIFQPQRIVKSLLYLASLVLSILFAVVWKSYIGTVVASLFQVRLPPWTDRKMLMLVLFVLETFPAGARITTGTVPNQVARSAADDDSQVVFDGVLPAFPFLQLIVLYSSWMSVNKHTPLM